MPTPDGPVFDAARESSHAAKSSVACLAASTSAARPAGAPGEARRERRQVGALLADALRAEDPEIPAVAGQVGLRLRQEPRDRAHSRGERRGALRGKGKLVGPELHGAVRERALARGLVALLREDRDVEGRVIGPGLQDAVVEVEARELRAHDVVIGLLRDRPAARIDRGQPPAPRRELLLLRGHRGGAVVRHPVNEPRLLECPPLPKERDQVLVARAPGTRGRAAGAAADERRGREQTGDSHDDSVFAPNHVLTFARV